MSHLPLIDQGLFKHYSSAKTISNGTAYYRKNAVRQIVVADRLIMAKVLGSPSYSVEICFTNRLIESVDCSCPYSEMYDGWCKHIIATLLYIDNHRDELEQQYQALSQYKNLNAEQLRELLGYLIDKEPKIATFVQSFLKTTNKKKKSTNLQEFRATLKQAFAHGPNNRKVTLIIQQIQKSINQLCTNEALNMLDIVFGQYVDYFFDNKDEYYDDDDYDYYDDDAPDIYQSQIEELATLLTQALLDANLQGTEKQRWQSKISAWLNRDEFLFEALGGALEVLEEPWDSGQLSEAMRGELEPEQFKQWYFKVSLAERVKCLYRRGLIHEGDNLAKACNLIDPIIENRIERKQIDSALELAKQHFRSANQVASLGPVLMQHANDKDQLRFGELAIQLAGPYKQLDTWLNGLAFSNKRYDLVMFLNRQLLPNEPEYKRFVQTKQIAGAEWPELRNQLLKRYRELPSSPQLFDILLEEGEIDLAIERLETVDPETYDYSILQVMKAASPSHPVWLQHMAEQYAHKILEAGQSRQYAHVIEQLAILKDALDDAQWLRFARKLYALYHRKRSFIDLLCELEPRFQR